MDGRDPPPTFDARTLRLGVKGAPRHHAKVQAHAGPVRGVRQGVVRARGTVEHRQLPVTQLQRRKVLRSRGRLEMQRVGAKRPLREGQPAGRDPSVYLFTRVFARLK